MNKLTSYDSAGKNSMCSAGDTVDVGLIPGSGISSEERNVNPLLIIALKKSHGQRTLAGYSPKGCNALDTTEQLSTSLLINILYFRHSAQLFSIHFNKITIVGFRTVLGSEQNRMDIVFLHPLQFPIIISLY